ncbi:UNVERIFIED_ORG: hypothetical protein QFZ59_000284 [Bacillus sp. B2I3]|nr:hypothetical protein [Bacillus sp. B2I3]
MSKGDPAGAKAPRRLPDRPRKAIAWSGNQRSQYKILKTCGQWGFHLRFHGDLIGTEGTRLLREYASKGDPQAQSAEEAHRTARGKRVPGEEINGHSIKSSKRVGDWVSILDFMEIN